MNFLKHRSLITNLGKLKVNNVHTNAALIDNCENVNNRNPRNLELIRIARKPTGYHLEKHIPSYWHKFTINKSLNNTTFVVEHFENGVVVQASTKEWPIKKRLYKCQDTAAYYNLARILAQRCLESGILCVYVDPELPDSNKVHLALSQLQEGGLSLSEPDVYKKPNPWDRERPEKPWEIIEK